VTGPDGADREAAEQLQGHDDAEQLGPEGETFEDLDLNDGDDWEFVP